MDPSVCILSEEEIFANYLTNIFFEKGCGVVVDSRSNRISPDVKYLIVINFNNAYTSDSELLKRISEWKIKTVVINDLETEGINVVNHPVRQIFIDQVVPGHSDLLSAIYSQSRSTHVFVPKEAWLSLTTMKDLGEEVLKETFSFPQSQKILFGKLLSFREIISVFNPVSLISINANSPQRIPSKDLSVVEHSIDLKSIPWHTLEAKAEEKKKTIKVKVPILKPPKPKVPKIKGGKSVIYSSIAAVLFLFILPYLLLSSATAMSLFSFHLFKNGNMGAAKNTLVISNVMAETSSRMLSHFLKLPLAREADVLASGTGAAGRVLAITDTANVITEESLKTLSLELSSLYRDLSFISGEYKDGMLPFSNYFPAIKNIDEYRQYLLTASEVSKYLPELLGFDRPKTYMVLLQNNMELRPTGGFIGSFALITVSKGQLIDDTIYDVYSADGQLKGYIKPPQPIEEHLGEASWTLRDSNWDPDFPTSSARAEWFLDKSMDREVDGVIGINLEAAKAYLEVVEPLYLLNFQHTIDSKNMYEKVQYEVEENFFPGSRKKAQYLSALAEALIGRVESASYKEYAKLLAATISKLNSRDIQVSLKNSSVSSVLKRQGWDGSIDTSDCLEKNCQRVFSGFIEANLGVNKANYFVERSVNVDVNLGENYIEQEVALKIRNKAANRNRIPEERYKAYVRAIAPDGASLQSAILYEGSDKRSVEVEIEKLKERVEFGAIIDVLPGEEKIIAFKFRTKSDINYTESGKIKYSWWKQSGTGEYPFNISFKTPSLSGSSFTPPYRLTEEGKYGYNTNLSEDFETELTFIKR